MLLGKHYLFLFPSKTHKKFPSQLDKIGWFSSQEFRALSNPSTQKDRTNATKPGQNRFFRNRNHSDQPSYVCDYSLDSFFNEMCFLFYTQIYLSFESTSMVDKLSALSCIEACISDINKWMLSNKLKLNNSKTEVLVIGESHRPHPQLDISLAGDENVVPTSSERNLGTVFDDKMTLESHVAAICKSAFFSPLGILLELSNICLKRILRL